MAFRERLRVVALRVDGGLTSRSPRLGEVERDDRTADCHVLGHLDECGLLVERVPRLRRQADVAGRDYLRETRAAADVPGERHVSLEAQTLHRALRVG